jgi:lysophospholipase L1-like esterase
MRDGNAPRTKKSAAIHCEVGSAILTNAAPWPKNLIARIATLIALGLLLCPPLALSADGQYWIGTWAASPQPSIPGSSQTFQNQTLRLIVHISAGGPKVRVKISNTFGREPLFIGAARIALRREGPEIDSASDRVLLFDGRSSVTVARGSMAVSDAVDLRLPALSDLAISLFLPKAIEATTLHILAKQTNYVSAGFGNSTSDVKFTSAKAIHSWPFLTGVDVTASPRGAAIIAFGSSLTDGDGTSSDTNGRWPDILAGRLQERANGKAEVGVLNEGIIGNRLLENSPSEAVGGRFGAALGQAGLMRFQRDVLTQSGAKFVILGLGINDIAFPGSLTLPASNVNAENVIAGYRKLIEQAHRKGIRIIGTTIPPFENSFLNLGKSAAPITFYTPKKEAVRRKVNDWILRSGEFDGVVDLDAVLRDKNHPAQLLPSYDSGDHLHPNNLGCLAEGKAIPLALFDAAKPRKTS